MYLKSPLANKLLKVTFSLYFIITLTLTLLHITAEYFQSRNRIYTEMDVILQSHQINLTQSLWDFDMEQVHAISNGLLAFSSIEGIQIKNIQGVVIKEVGLVQGERDEIYRVDLPGTRHKVVENLALFSKTYPTIFNSGEQQENLGEVILYSSEGAVVRRVKLGLYFIIGNSIIKTIALWLIFFWVFGKFLGDPLTVATQFIQGVQLNHLEGLKANWGIKGDHELKLLENAFNSMLQNHEKAEKELSKSRRSLKSLKNYLDNIIDSMPSILIGLDMKKKITLWNLQAEKETNILADDAMGKALESIYPLIQGRASKIAQSLKEKKMMIEEKIEHIVEGKKRFRDITFYPLKGEDAEGMVLRVDDVTQKVELAELQQSSHEREIREQEQLHYQGEIEEKNDQLHSTIFDLKKTRDQLVLSEKMAALGRLVAGVAHEINTPLGNAIMGVSFIREQTQGLQKKYEDNKMQKQEFTNFLTVMPTITTEVEQSLTRVANLVQSFKLVSTDQESFTKKSFQVGEYIGMLLETIHSELKVYDPEIIIQGQKDSTLFSYPKAFFQVINQLLFNSLHHGFEIGKKGTIVFDLSTVDNRFILKYSDDGRGIPSKDLNHIFDPFFTTERGQGMVGLGLHIVFNLVHHVLEGKIECTSQVGKGTTYTISIPLGGGEDRELE